MANSDDVLCAGLISKYIDMPELMANVQFVTKLEYKLLNVPKQYDEVLVFSISPHPGYDFAFSLHALTPAPSTLTQDSTAVLFCVDGQATADGDGRQCILQSGEPVFYYIAAKIFPITVNGGGRLARVYNQSE